MKISFETHKPSSSEHIIGIEVFDWGSGSFGNREDKNLDSLKFTFDLGSRLKKRFQMRVLTLCQKILTALNIKSKFISEILAKNIVFIDIFSMITGNQEKAYKYYRKFYKQTLKNKWKLLHTIAKSKKLQKAKKLDQYRNILDEVSLKMTNYLQEIQQTEELLARKN
jgi:hypothetical protein